MKAKSEVKKLPDEAIRTQVQILYRALMAEERRYNQERASIEYRRNIIQRHCNHTKTTYHPDPSGNSDSSDVCDICSKEV